ncbi:hypothetical protein DPMN_156329 [Dreissena polymorpha]|uniref:Uncharacterized protein n=1 Tax=Dreissena polymorpha TaxID=45954 RepID=A0A9D4FR22_DREPO|nr:hypothetical protein DPMN_156329 [Dreissena polymorpha]
MWRHLMGSSSKEGKPVESSALCGIILDCHDLNIYPELSTANSELNQARNCIKPKTVSSPELYQARCMKPGSSVLSNSEQTMPGKRTNDVLCDRPYTGANGVVGNVNEYDVL